jgi:hypothetical protein
LRIRFSPPSGAKTNRRLYLESLEKRLTLSAVADNVAFEFAPFRPQEAEAVSRTEPIPLSEELPRLVRIVNTHTSEKVFDHWHYAESIDLSFLEAGTYTLEHAGSGEDLQQLTLVTGLDLPSHRVAFRQIDAQFIEFDFGNLGEYSALDVRVTGETAEHFQGWLYDRQLRLRVPEGDVHLQVARPSGPFHALTFSRMNREPVTLPGALPRRVRIVNAGSEEVVSDSWNYTSTLDIHLLPAGHFDVFHAASGESWSQATLYTGLDLPSGRVVIQRKNGYLDVDWGSLGNHRAFYARINHDGESVFDAWHYDTHLGLQLPDRTTSLELAIPSEQFSTFWHRPKLTYEIPPHSFSTLSVRPVNAPFRQDLSELGQYEVIAISTFLRAMNCADTVQGTTHRFTCGEQEVRWNEGAGYMTDPLDMVNIFVLPLMPFHEKGELYFPLRILAEKLGFNTFYDAANHSVSVFRLAKEMRELSLKLDQTISGSDLSFSYFIAAHETRDHIYLVYDHSPSIIRFNKSDFGYVKLTALPEHGNLNEFVVSSNGEIIVGTMSGYLLKWVGDRFEVIGGGGTELLTTLGEQTSLMQLQTSRLNKLILRDDTTLFMVDDGNSQLYRVDLQESTATLIAISNVVGSILDLDLYAGYPLIIGHGNKLTWVNSDNYSVTHSPCFQQLFNPREHRVYSARPIAHADRWVILSAGRREVYEIGMGFEGEQKPCSVIRTTYTGDDTAFLNGLGTIDPAIEEPNRVLVIDSDGFNLVNYTIGGTVSVITKFQLGRAARTTFISPTTIAPKGTDLFILGNTSHQIFRHSLLTGTTDVFVGSGNPERNERTNVHRLQISIGYPNEMKFVGEELWIADHYGRRVIAVNGDDARQLFAPTDWREIGGILAFDVVDGNLYFVDHASGSLAHWRPGDAQVESFAGYVNPDWIQNSEDIRRSESLKSAHDMDTKESVVFGLPQSVAAIGDGRLVVSDLYRQGLWIVDPQSGYVERLAGLNSNANYHYGAFTGNVGLSAQELRIGSPVMVVYDAQRRVLIVGGGYSRAVIFIRDDFSKTCLAYPDVPTEFISQAMFLPDGRMAVVDTPRNAVHIFRSPDLSCLDSATVSL